MTYDKTIIKIFKSQQHHTALSNIYQIQRNFYNKADFITEFFWQSSSEHMAGGTVECREWRPRSLSNHSSLKHAAQWEASAGVIERLDFVRRKSFRYTELQFGTQCWSIFQNCGKDIAKSFILTRFFEEKSVSVNWCFMYCVHPNGRQAWWYVFFLFWYL